MRMPRRRARARTPFVDERTQVYKKLVVNADGTRLLGAILVGDAADYGIWLQMMLNGMALPAHPESMLFPAGAAAAGAQPRAAASPRCPRRRRSAPATT